MRKQKETEFRIQILILTMISFPIGRHRYRYLGKFQICLVDREVIALETKCGTMVMFDTVWERTSSNNNSQKLGKNPSAPSRSQACDLMITCVSALLLGLEILSTEIVTKFI